MPPGRDECLKSLFKSGALISIFAFLKAALNPFKSTYPLFFLSLFCSKGTILKWDLKKEILKILW